MKEINFESFAYTFWGSYILPYQRVNAYISALVAKGKRAGDEKLDEALDCSNRITCEARGFCAAIDALKGLNSGETWDGIRLAFIDDDDMLDELADDIPRLIELLSVLSWYAE